MTHQEPEKPHYSGEIKGDHRKSRVDPTRSGKPGVTRRWDQLDSIFTHTGQGVNRARTNRIISKGRKKKEREDINVKIPPLWKRVDLP